MNLLQETASYLGMGYLDLPDDEHELREEINRANLYYRWGKESGQKDDFYQVLRGLETVDDAKLARRGGLLPKYDRMLDACLEILRLELKDAAFWFDFLCEHRMRIELREMSFGGELDRKIGDFMDREEGLQRRTDEIRGRLTEIHDLSDEDRESRKKMMENFETERKKVSEGIEAFYARVKEYVRQGKK